MSKTSSIKTAAILYIAFAIAFLVSVIGISSGNNFKHEHRDAIERVGYEPAPEINRYHISTGLAWEATNDSVAGVFKIAGLLLFVAFGFFLYAVSAGKIEFERANANKATFIILVGVAACLFAAYSSTYVSNWVDVTPDQNAAIQNSKAVLADIFKAKELIK